MRRSEGADPRVGVGEEGKCRGRTEEHADCANPPQQAHQGEIGEVLIGIREAPASFLTPRVQVPTHAGSTTAVSCPRRPQERRRAGSRRISAQVYPVPGGS